MEAICDYTVCTDVAASITGKHLGAVILILKNVPNITQTHCIIHCEVLVAKHLIQSLSEFLSFCVKIVNFIKTRPLQSQMFSKLCGELG